MPLPLFTYTQIMTISRTKGCAKRIALQYNCSERTIRRIRRGEVHSEITGKNANAPSTARPTGTSIATGNSINNPIDRVPLETVTSPGFSLIGKNDPTPLFTETEARSIEAKFALPETRLMSDATLDKATKKAIKSIKQALKQASHPA